MSTFAHPFARLRLYTCLAVIGCSTPLAHAQSLQSILADALVNDPQLLEAKANEIGAHNAMKATRAGHYPVLSMVGNQMIARDVRGQDNSAYRRFNPGLKGSLNVYSWGGINSAVQRDKAKERYYHYKYDETREELGNTIGQLYLDAVRARESLRILEQNLKRHDKIIHDLEIIVKHDTGRRSELTQAKSRRLQVESNMAQTRRSMDLSLSRLSRYTSNSVKEQELQGPFTDLQPNEIIQRYRNPDLTSTPSYQAQDAELQSARANVRVSKAARLPALNLEGQVTRDTKEVYLNFSWNIFDQAAKYSVAQNAQTMIAAESRLSQMLREVQEKSRTAETDMQQSSRRAAITKAQIAAQQQVVKAYEMQFKIARRSLIDVLDSYSELSGVEMAHATAQNDYRDAALSYLRAQAQIFNWASDLTSGSQNAKLAAKVDNQKDKKAAESVGYTAAADKAEPFVFAETKSPTDVKSTESHSATPAEASHTQQVADTKSSKAKVERKRTSMSQAPVEKVSTPATENQAAAPVVATASPMVEKTESKSTKAKQQPDALPLAEKVEAKPAKLKPSQRTEKALPGEVPLKPIAAMQESAAGKQTVSGGVQLPGEQPLVPVNNASTDTLDLYIQDLMQQESSKSKKKSNRQRVGGDSLDQYIHNFLQASRKS